MNLHSMTFSDIVMSFLRFCSFCLFNVNFSDSDGSFRDDDLHISFKVVWIVLLLFIPVICSIIYLLVRGREWRKDSDIITINILTQGTPV